MKRFLSSLTLFAAMLILLAAGGCSTGRKAGSGATPQAAYKFHIPSHASRLQQAIYREASSWLGTPYRYAGEDKQTGVDCSGMVMRVYSDVAGWKLPRNSAKQAEFCIPLKSTEVEVGDLVFFATGKDPARISHVGIMLDKENFIHASTSKGVVVSKVTSPYYTRTFMMYGRVPQATTTPGFN